MSSSSETRRSVSEICGIGWHHAVTQTANREYQALKDVGQALKDAALAGITLSPKQQERATQLAKERGLANCSFRVMDALNMDLPEGHFDLVWACESGEHMPDKQRYVEQMMRVLAPGEHQVQAGSAHCRCLALMSHAHSEHLHPCTSAPRQEHDPPPPQRPLGRS